MCIVSRHHTCWIRFATFFFSSSFRSLRYAPHWYVGPSPAAAEFKAESGAGNESWLFGAAFFPLPAETLPFRVPERPRAGGMFYRATGNTVLHLLLMCTDVVNYKPQRAMYSARQPVDHHMLMNHYCEPVRSRLSKTVHLLSKTTAVLCMSGHLLQTPVTNTCRHHVVPRHWSRSSRHIHRCCPFPSTFIPLRCLALVR